MSINKEKIKQRSLITVAALAIVIGLLAIYFKYIIPLSPPQWNDLHALKTERVKVGDNFYVLGNNWLRKNKQGLWEMYVEGNAFDRGVVNGKLSQDLLINQENTFVNQINTLIPSKFYLGFLNNFVALFNRNIDKYVSPEYLLEIYGISHSASDSYEKYGSKYQRILNYHAAHDIGHALQNLHMVGCTSFSVWGNKSSDGNLLVGRNFDFYFGDEFARDKIVCFLSPDKGYKFMMVTWGGMVGAVSGMNEKGLTVTINAAKSEIPLGARTPISIVTREILQYAGNISEAYAIASKRRTFVSESIMIGSAADNKTVIIEKTPSQTVLYSTANDYIISTNHFQSKILGKSKPNVEFMNQSSTVYRYQRVGELLNRYPKINYQIAAKILRNQDGLGDRNIGMGNEKAINQLIAHHSIIFEPAKLLVWVSGNPYQLGEYVCYDLNTIFSKYRGLKQNIEISKADLNIPADTFLGSKGYQNYQFYRKYLQKIKNFTGFKQENARNPQIINQFISSNPEYYETYAILGDYYCWEKVYEKSIKYYTLALSKEIPDLNERNKIIKLRNKCLANCPK